MNKTKFMILAGVVALLIAGLVAFNFPTLSEKQPEPAVASELVITSTPREIDLKVNGEDYGRVASGEPVSIMATGQVQLVASREGFSTVELPWQLASAGTNAVTVELEAQSDEAKAVVAEELDLQVQDKSTREFEKTTEEAFQKYPILSDMPVWGNRFELYQGLPTDKAHEFGIYLYLFEGAEDEGRAAFNAWMKDHGYDPASYNVVEEVKPAKPSTVLPEIPTGDALDALTVDSITVAKKPNLEERTADELAQYFGIFTASWEPKVDGYVEASELRAKPLMSKKLAEATEVPHRPTITFNWQVAQSEGGKSFPWVQSYESTTKGGETKAKMEVCWAWVNGDDDLIYDAPRELEVTVKKNKVQSYFYTDGDPFVDHSDTTCDPKNR